ncbi:MAG: DUF2807 domain-containing protein, partial [Flavobacteriaceae bacterium]|nr:DUF2807 domain-containing protein [Flavobacteriaceae bacterium]
MKSVNYFLSIVAFLLVLTVSAQEKLKGNRIVATENRGNFDFEKIEIGDGVDVLISQGDETTVSVEADENLMNAIITEATNNTLFIKLSEEIRSKKELKVLVTANSLLSQITIKDKSDITSNSTLFLDSFTLNAEGDSKVSLNLDVIHFYLNNNESANVNLSVKGEEVYLKANKTGKGKVNISADKVEVITQGSSSLELTGECKSLNIKAENRSNAKAAELETEEAVVTCSDTSNTFVNAKIKLTVSAINSSEVSIY